jgi:8-oxo-dGTP pyrophosphatase MutT (NUDIX family)
MIHRPSNMRSHPGQVAFPGGKIDPGEDAVEAALREAHEELGIHARDVTVIGTSDVYSTGSGYAIVPVIAVVPPDIELNPSPTEVAAWFEAPVDFVFDPANHTHHEAFWQGRERRYIEIMWQQHRIWGVTAGIIANLARRIAW